MNVPPIRSKITDLGEAIRCYKKLYPFLALRKEWQLELYRLVIWMPNLTKNYRRLRFREYLLLYQIPFVDTEGSQGVGE